jgi:hypothetical protein
MGRTIGPWGRPQRLVGDNPGVTVGGNSRCSLSRWLPDRLEAGMPNSRRTPAEERAASVAAAVVLAALVIVPIVGLVGLVAFYFGAQGHEVGPDADQMAKDPVLHIEIDHASPGEISGDTGEEGGIAPALANSISTARRDWARSLTQSTLSTSRTSPGAHCPAPHSPSPSTGARTSSWATRRSSRWWTLPRTSSTAMDRTSGSNSAATESTVRARAHQDSRNPRWGTSAPRRSARRSPHFKRDRDGRSGTIWTATDHTRAFHRSRRRRRCSMTPGLSLVLAEGLAREPGGEPHGVVGRRTRMTSNGRRMLCYLHASDSANTATDAPGCFAGRGCRSRGHRAVEPRRGCPL